ncbi:MAG: SMC-Scp complex subunit ScpB [bacterium]|nr:SMC-Scp complex subunit ScpB [Candidatus Margulisiibacteriota bacterium]
MMNIETEVNWTKIKTILESVLFVARKPLSVDEIVEVVGYHPELIKTLLEELIVEHQSKGINVVKVAGGYLMGTAADNAEYVHKVLHKRVETTLTPKSLETLAIIAYKQPVTRAEIERVRGVNSDGPIDTLLAKRLIKDLGRSEAPGRPYIYETTTEFLRHFGLESLKNLPPLPVTEGEQEEIFKSALHE